MTSQGETVKQFQQAQHKIKYNISIKSKQKKKKAAAF